MTITAAQATGHRQGTFRHEAFFYEDDAAYLDEVAAFVRDGLEAGEPTMVVLGGPKLTALRSELGGDVAGLVMADMAEVGANPARIIPAWRRFVDRAGGRGVHVRGVGEPISSGRSPAELVESQLHEALLNVAFNAAGDFTLLCPYDAARMGDEVVDEARRSHAFLRAGVVSGPCAEFDAEASVATLLEAPLPEP
ncbi:MAG: MEDS domain-containing protein, partial [Acidimicrobiales bacterium]